MLEIYNQDFFNGAVRFNIYLLVINILLLVHFFSSWAFYCNKEKKLVNYWYFFIFLFFVFPVLMMYPFNASIKNIGAMGENYFKVEPFVNYAYFISIIGYISVWIGGMVSSKKYNRINNKNYYFIDTLIEGAFGTGKAFRYFLTFMFLCMIGFLLFQLYGGYLGDPRSFFMKNNIYRPIFNFLLSAFKLTLVILGILVIQKNKRCDKLFFCFFVATGLFLGTRSTLLDPIAQVFLFYIMFNSEKVKLWYIVLFGLVVLGFVFLLGEFRSSRHQLKLVDSLLYGNSYSDTRDFAWILTFWDYHYALGKTYLAGWLSFLPAHFSNYREVWSISRYTNQFVGFDSSIHPGLRPGKFGEAFLNFGLSGVIVLGLTLGYWLHRASDNINEEVKNGKNVIKAFAKTVPFQVITFFCITANFFELYVWIAITIFLFSLNRFIFKGQ